MHEEIQKSIWKNKLKTSFFWLYKPSTEDELIHLICHCIFDKKDFKEIYKLRIIELLNRCDQIKFINHLELIFFKFTYKLVSILKKNQFDRIIPEYFSFSNY